MTLAFDRPVPCDGYTWWYLDAVSDDSRHGLTLIAFIGSVFSPYYARARTRGRGDPLDHCAINVALYGPASRWSMTERSRSAVSRDRDRLHIGPSRLSWDGRALAIEVREWAVPVPRRVHGHIQVHPTVIHGEPLLLDPSGRHQWTPVAPSARVEVTLQHPALRWSGTGYLDYNAGTEPLERGFHHWSWSRAATRRGPVVLYETQPTSGPTNALALHFDRDGRRHTMPAPPEAPLPRSRWGLSRSTRSEDGQARLVASWEDTPFYSRSLVAARMMGQPVTAVHESLSLRRFAAPWVQVMLPFRMPRRRG